jgi:hypothetical protein
MLNLRNTTILAVLIAIGSLLLPAQSFVGSVRGLIQDPAGAVIVNAHVTLKNEAAGTARETVTTAGGEYVFSQIEPATYTLVVETSGFKKLERKGVIVGTQEKLNLDLRMQLGEVNQSVEVTSAVPLIENATASNGQVLNIAADPGSAEPGPEHLSPIEAYE